MTAAWRVVDEDLARPARPCKDNRSLAHVATLASGGDEAIGELVPRRSSTRGRASFQSSSAAA